MADLMDPRYSDEDGEFAVKTARKVIEEYLSSRKVYRPEKYPKKFEEKAGVFTTLRHHPSRELRGCIGIPEPIMPLIDALIRSAISAATEDPRFIPVDLEEMNQITVEVSLLTPPEKIVVKDPKEYPSKIKVGRDGLIIRRGFYSGLLLPQVAVEYGWSEEEFLAHTCWKAGLNMDCWLLEGTEIYKFQAEIFEEEEPRGRIKRLEI